MPKEGSRIIHTERIPITGERKLFSHQEVFMEDRDKLIEMLAKVRDNFSLNTYKKVYQITDQEIEEKKAILEAKGEKKH